MSIEIEMKLAASPEKINDIQQWFSEKFQAEAVWETKQLINTYYDTRHRKLREMDIGLRMRRDGETYIQSVKSAGRVVGGLYQRNECEVELPSHALDLVMVSDPYLMILIEEAQEDDGEIRPIFRTDFVRKQIVIEYKESTIEIALDKGVISNDTVQGDSNESSHVSISEVELELKSGEPAVLFELCELLIQEFELVLDSRSKAERGYRLGEKLNNLYVKRLQVVPLTAKSPAEGSFETIAHAGLDHWQHYIKRIKQESTVDNVLQLNRSLSYMQHMYATFAPVIPRQSLIGLRKDWREITQNFAKLLKVARELNWLENAEMYGFDFPELEELHKGLLQAFRRESEHFVEYLNSASYNLRLLHFSRWLYLKEWRVGLRDSYKQRLEKEIFPFAIKQLQHQLRDMQRHLNVKETLSEKEYLAFLPKMYKTLDVGLFFGSLFDSKKRHTYRQKWVDLVAMVELFKQLDFVRGALKSMDICDTRLEETENDILEQLVVMRDEAQQQNPYWN